MAENLAGQLNRERLGNVIEMIWESQVACADAIGIHKNTVNAVVKGRYSPPYPLIEAIASAGYSLDYLYNRSNVIKMEGAPQNPRDYCREVLSDEELLGIVRERMASYKA